MVNGEYGNSVALNGEGSLEIDRLMVNGEYASKARLDGEGSLDSNIIDCQCLVTGCRCD
jgi:hypothetical protein